MSKYLLVHLFLFVLRTGTTSGQLKCGRGPSMSRLTGKVVGGYDVGYYKYPWYATLDLDGEIWCGGSLIGDKTIITAAHCFKAELNKTKPNLEAVFTIRMGVYNDCNKKEKTQKRFKVKKVIVHENYMKQQPYFDIAIIKLYGNLDEYEPVCLPPKVLNEDERGREGLIIGFGTTKANEEIYPCKMKEGRILIYPNTQCKQMILNVSSEEEDYNFRGAFCAGYVEGGVDACQGDSGGPLMIVGQEFRYTIFGITSFGYGCGEKNLPGLYTDVSKYIDWIEKNSGIRQVIVAPTTDRTTSTSEAAIPTPSPPNVNNNNQNPYNIISSLLPFFSKPSRIIIEFRKRQKKLHPPRRRWRRFHRKRRLHQG